MNPTTAALITFLKSKGWDVRLRSEPCEVVLPRGEASQISPPLREFFALVEGCVDSNQTCWFNCLNEFCGQTDNAFVWNEWEILSRHAVDAKEEATHAFWADHLPFFMGVQPFYCFLSARLSDGAICFGSEPEFEEVSVVASSFTELIHLLENRQLDVLVQRLFM